MTGVRKKGPVLYNDLARRVRTRLIDHRLERQLSLHQAAELSGFSRNGLEKIETGDVQPTLETLLKLSTFYEETLPQFFALVFGEAQLAEQVRAKLNSKSVEKAEQEKMFLELAQKLGRAPFLNDLNNWAELEKKNPQALAAVRTLVESLLGNSVTSKSTSKKRN